MEKINKVEINGESYDIECGAENIYAGVEEPTTEPKPGIWFKPYGIYSLRYSIGMEGNSTNVYGTYTVDTNGQLIESTGTGEADTRASKMFGVGKNNKYYLRVWNTMTGTGYPISIYFYNSNKEYIDKATVTTEADTSYSYYGNPLLDIVPPENTAYFRVVCPYSYIQYLCIAMGDKTRLEMNRYYQASRYYGEACFMDLYIWEDDHYVRY